MKEYWQNVITVKTFLLFKTSQVEGKGVALFVDT